MNNDYPAAPVRVRADRAGTDTHAVGERLAACDAHRPDAERRGLVDLLDGRMPGAATRQRILVNNPARPYGL